MRATIIPGENHIRIDDVALTVAANLMPAAIDLEGFVTDAARPIKIITFDGIIGIIERASRVHGRNDIEYFLGAEPLKAFVEVHAAEKARAEEERAKQAAAQEAATEETRRHYEFEARARAAKGDLA